MIHGQEMLLPSFHKHLHREMASFVDFVVELYLMMYFPSMPWLDDGIKPQVHGSTDVVIKDIVLTGSYEFN